MPQKKQNKVRTLSVLGISPPHSIFKPSHEHDTGMKKAEMSDFGMFPTLSIACLFLNVIFSLIDFCVTFDTFEVFADFNLSHRKSIRP